MTLKTESEEHVASKVEDKRCCNINSTYLPLKVHYFFLFAGMGSTTPFMQVLARDFGMSPTATGIIYTIVPLFVTLSKPAFGFITDKLQDFKATLMTLLLVTALAFYAILYIPPIKDMKVASIQVTAACNDHRKQLIITPPSYSPYCAREISNKQFDCKLAGNCIENQILGGSLGVKHVPTFNKSMSLSFIWEIYLRNLSEHTCVCLKHNFTYITCEPDFYKCDSFENHDSFSEFETYNYWIFALLAILSGTGSVTAMCLSDAACNEILSDNSEQYGKQRLWASISWGLANLLSGYLNDIFTANAKDANYSPAFYLMLGFVTVDIVLVYKLRLKKSNISKNICKDIGILFLSSKTIVFSIGVYISGTLTGLLLTYEFWYLKDLGSSQLLLGLTSTIQCAAEVPLFFYSGWFVRKFGHFYCLIAILVAFSLRTGLYSLLVNPWLVLPIDVLHGVTYAIFFATLTLYAVDFAPPGTEATMLGILGGIYEGLGVATGSFLGGFGFDSIGGRWTFFVASLVSICCAILLIIANTFLPRTDKKLDLVKISTIDIQIYISDRSKKNSTS